MTTFISRNEKYMGFDFLKIRAFLKAIHFYQTPKRIKSLKPVDLHPSLLTGLYQEFMDSGLVISNPNDYDEMQSLLTPNGFAIASSSATKRTSKSSAQKILDKIIENAFQANRDRDFPLIIEKIWLFGSMIDASKSDVGDIDIVIETSIKPKLQNMGLFDCFRYVNEKFPNTLPESFSVWLNDPFEYLAQRKLFGPRRHPLISQNDLRTLIAMHVPCQIVFDRKRTAKNKVLAHHPQSNERSDYIRPKLVVPSVNSLKSEYKLLSISNEKPWQFIDAFVLLKDEATSRSKGEKPYLNYIISEKTFGKRKKNVVEVRSNCKSKKKWPIEIIRFLKIDPANNKHTYIINAKLINPKGYRNATQKIIVAGSIALTLAKIAMAELSRLHLRRQEALENYDIEVIIKGDATSIGSKFGYIEQAIQNAAHPSCNRQYLHIYKTYSVLPFINSGKTVITINNSEFIKFVPAFENEMAAVPAHISGNEIPFKKSTYRY